MYIQARQRYMNPARESIKAMLAWGWTLDQDQSRFSSNRDSVKRRASKANVVTNVDGDVQDYLFHNQHAE